MPYPRTYFYEADEYNSLRTLLQKANTQEPIVFGSGEVAVLNIPELTQELKSSLLAKDVHLLKLEVKEGSHAPHYNYHQQFGNFPFIDEYPIKAIRGNINGIVWYGDKPYEIVDDSSGKSVKVDHKQDKQTQLLQFKFSPPTLEQVYALAKNNELHPDTHLRFSSKASTLYNQLAATAKQPSYRYVKEINELIEEHQQKMAVVKNPSFEFMQKQKKIIRDIIAVYIHQACLDLTHQDLISDFLQALEILWTKSSLYTAIQFKAVQDYVADSKHRNLQRPIQWKGFERLEVSIKAILNKANTDEVAYFDNGAVCKITIDDLDAKLKERMLNSHVRQLQWDGRKGANSMFIAGTFPCLDHLECTILDGDLDVSIWAGEGATLFGGVFGLHDGLPMPWGHEGKSKDLCYHMNIKLENPFPHSIMQRIETRENFTEDDIEVLNTLNYLKLHPFSQQQLLKDLNNQPNISQDFFINQLTAVFQQAAKELDENSCFATQKGFYDQIFVITHVACQRLSTRGELKAFRAEYDRCTDPLPKGLSAYMLRHADDHLSETMERRFPNIAETTPVSKLVT